MTATIIHLPVRNPPARAPSADPYPEITWLFLWPLFLLAWTKAGTDLAFARVTL